MTCPLNLWPIVQITDFEKMKTYFRTNYPYDTTFYMRRADGRYCTMLGNFIGFANYSKNDPNTFRHHVNGHTRQSTDAELAEINQNTLFFSHFRFGSHHWPAAAGAGIQICIGPPPPPPEPTSWFPGSFFSGGKKNRKTASKKRRRTKKKTTRRA